MNISDGKAQAVINMTPMIDVLLVLLIIFMAITPVAPTGLDAAVPRDSADMANPAKENPVVLEIRSDGSYRLNASALPKEALRTRLIQVFERRADRVLFLKGAADLDFSAVASVIDTAHGVNIENVALMPR